MAANCALPPLLFFPLNFFFQIDYDGTDLSNVITVGSVLVDGEEQIDSDAGAKYAADTAGETTNYMPSREFVEPHLSPRNAWVRCDDCLKWRRISNALADAIEDTNSSWYAIPV